VIKVKEESKE